MNPAQAATGFQGLYDKVAGEVVYPVIGVVIALAVLAFFYTGYKFVRNVDSEKRGMYGMGLLYGIIGLSIIFGAASIVALIRSLLTGFAG